MSIMDMFRSIAQGGTAKAGDGSPSPQPNGGDPSKLNPAVPGDGTAQNKDGSGPTAIPKAAEGDKSPLEGYGKLWETDPNAKKTPSLAPTFTADPAKLMEAAKTIDFAKVIDPEVLTKAAAGDGAALSQAINSAAQAGYAQSAHATTKIVERALADQAKMFKEEIMPAILREHSISTAVSADNAIFENPAVKPIVDMATAQLSAKYPNASAADIKKHAQEYFMGFAKELATAGGMTMEKAVDPAGSKVSGIREPQDWGKYFGVETPTT